MDEDKFLAELTIAVTKGFTNSLKDKISKIWLKNEYGVTLEPKEGESLKRIGENEFYRVFKKYLGEHWSIKLIKVGLYISELNEEGKRKRAQDLQNEAYKKHGPKGVKIIQLASTGILIPVMGYIIDLKLYKDANPIVLNQAFDKILEEWDMVSVPVNNDTNEITLKHEIISKMDYNHPIFFVYAAGNPSRIAQLTLAKMNNEALFSGKYLMTPKIKMIDNTEYCLWIFEKVQDVHDSIISKQVIK